MKIKSKGSCLNVDNVFGLESIICLDDRMHMKLNRKLSISHWNVSDGITFLINPHWNCLGNHQAVFLYSKSYVALSNELVFKVQTVHPTDVIDEYEFLIRPNNEYHRNLLFYDRITEHDNKTTDHLKPFNYSFTGTLFDASTPFTNVIKNYFRISCENCTVEGTTELSAHIRGPSLLNKAHAVIETGIGSALNLKLILVLKSVGIFLNPFSWNRNLFKLKLFPWSVPGIFEPGIFTNTKD